jgi:hypothetical protein
MANRADNTATSTDVIPAGHAAPTAEDEHGEHRSDASTGLAGLSVATRFVSVSTLSTVCLSTRNTCWGFCR